MKKFIWFFLVVIVYIMCHKENNNQHLLDKVLFRGPIWITMIQF